MNNMKYSLDYIHVCICVYIHHITMIKEKSMNLGGTGRVGGRSGAE